MNKLSISLLAIGVAGCGGKTGTITLDIVTSPLNDPFVSAATVQVTAGAKTQMVSVNGGHFSIEIDQQPPSGNAMPVVLQGFDSNMKLVAYGETPPLALSAVDQEISLWVGQPGSVATPPAVLGSGRTDLAGVGSTGVGGIFAGGRDASGTTLDSTELYDVYSQQVIEVAKLTTARAGAAMFASPPNGVVFGGAQGSGQSSPTGPLSTGELFDPSSGTGLWVAVPTSSPSYAGSYASSCVLGSGSGLVTGGEDASGMPLANAVIISTTGTVEISPLTMTMEAARLHHAVSAARFPSGDGALIIGGLADGSAGPVVEELIGQAFSTQSLTTDVTTIENRWGATATPVSGGVLLIGGTIPDMSGNRVATASVVFIPTEIAGQVITRSPSALSTPRAGHTATLVGADILLCGGIDDQRHTIANCELLGTNPVVSKKVIPTGIGRTGHVAVTLETGPVLIAGGADESGTPVNTIEIYTPVPMAAAK